MREFKAGPIRKLGNVMMTALARAGIGPGYLHILTTVGRKSGLPRSNPVLLVVENDRRWLVAPYGVVAWVKNARAAGRVTLSRGRRRMEYRTRQIEDEEAGRILKKYVKMAPIVIPYFEAGLASSKEEFAAEAEDHPVFELLPD
ncbi:MAG: nitroreductase family deazaflavin-dependent oxidoreductase [Actinomycetota bacterium]